MLVRNVCRSTLRRHRKTPPPVGLGLCLSPSKADVTTLFSTGKSSLAALVLLADGASHVTLYLWAFSFDLPTLWDKDVTNFAYKTSLADVFFLMLMRLWISG
eukprot:1195762-Prorocentrum_minimum.AAC.6